MAFSSIRETTGFEIETSQLGACLKDIYYLPVGAENSTLNLVHLKGPEDYCLPLGHQRLGMPTDDRIG